VRSEVQRRRLTKHRLFASLRDDVGDQLSLAMVSGQDRDLLGGVAQQPHELINSDHIFSFTSVLKGVWGGTGLSKTLEIYERLKQMTLVWKDSETLTWNIDDLKGSKEARVPESILSGTRATVAINHWQISQLTGGISRRRDGISTGPSQSLTDLTDELPPAVQLSKLRSCAALLVELDEGCTKSNKSGEHRLGELRELLKDWVLDSRRELSRMRESHEKEGGRWMADLLVVPNQHDPLQARLFEGLKIL
jgi:hypothetical protein